MQQEQLSRKQLLVEIQRLRQEVRGLKQDKADLEILLETTIEHSDTVEAQLQNQAEEVVRESEKRLAQFLEAVPVGVFVVDARGKAYYANRAAQHLLGKGITPEASVQQLAEVYQVYIAGTDQVYPNSQLPIVQALRGESGIVDDMEIRQGNRTISLEARATPIFNEKSEIVYAIAAFQDITQHKRSQQALEEQKKQYQDIFEATSDGLIINTLDGKIAEANPAACVMHGYSHEEFINLNPKTFIHPDYYSLFDQFIEITYYQNRSFEAQAVDLRKDGTDFPVEVRGTAFTYKGQPHILAVVRDITERKRAETQLRLAQERDRLLAEITLRIRQSLDLEQILNRTVVEVRQFLQTDRVCICYVDSNWQTKVVAESVAPDRPSVLGITITNQIFSKDLIASFEQGVRAINDLSQEDLLPVSAEILQRIQVRACLGVPIMLDISCQSDNQLVSLEQSENHFDDRGFWLLVAHQCSGARDWQALEINLLEQLGNQVAIAIQQAKLYQQLAALNANNEASLKESEERLRTLINSTPDVICFKDGAGSWLESNQANLVFLDLKGVDYRGKTDAELAQFSNFYQDALLGCIQTDEQAWQHGSTYRVEEIVPRPDGTTSIWDMIKVPLFYPDGGRKGLVILGRDISDRKRAESALRESEAQYRALVETANCIILRWDTDGNIRFMSEYGQRLLGFKSSEIIGRNVVGTIVPETETSGRDLQALMVDICQHPENYLFNENENLCKNGARVWIVWANKPIFDQQGNLVEILSVGTDATQRKRAEEALRLSESRFRALYESNGFAVMLADIDKSLSDCNSAAEKLFGYSRQQMAGMHPGDFSPPFQPNGRDSYSLANEHTALALKYGSHSSEWVHRRADGTDFPAEVWLTAVEVGKGKFVQAIIQDLSERKIAEQALRRSEQKYRNIFENSQVGIGRTRLKDGLILDANQRFAEIVGYSSATDLIDKRFTTEFLVNPGDRQQILAQVQQHGEVRNFELPLRHSNGSIKWNLLSLRLSAEEGCLDFVMADISKRKQLEEELLHRAQVQSLLSSISRHFIDQDVDTAINFTLQAIAQFIGTERSCIFAYSDDQTQFHITHEWCIPGVPALPSASRGAPSATLPWFSRQILSGETIQLAKLAELPPEAAAERKIFEHHAAQSLVAVPTIHSGKVVGFLGVDVVNCSKTWSQEEISLLKLVGELIAIGRARHQAESALRIAKEAAEAANRAKSAFLANMSHELRTPLNAILGFAQLMERDDGLTSRQGESLEIINRSGEHLLNLINDVLEMSKIEAGRITLNPERFDLHRLLQTLQEMFQIRAEAKKLSLQFEIAAVPQYVITDEGKLRQVLINLLSNAVKFTERGKVTLRAGKEDKGNSSFYLYFEVEDTGTGIALEEIDSLFQPFVQTTSGTQAREGTGLGLTISRQFVQLMGGDIYLTSTVGQGSIFRFEVPITAVEQPQEAQQVSRGRVLRLAADQPECRILVVDDRLENRKLLDELLQTVGFQTRAVADGQEAITAWSAWHPDLILMDMRMPVMDGYQASRRIRTLEKAQSNSRQQTAIVALTASAFEEQRGNILAAGCNDLVRKPFREEVLFDKIAEHLGVQYVYEDNQQSGSSDQVKGSESYVLKAESLTVMSIEWIAQLHQAATRVNSKLVLQLLEQIPEEHHLLAHTLKDLVNSYRFDTIVDLTCQSD